MSLPPVCLPSFPLVPARFHYRSGLPGGTQSGLIKGKWMLATEEGCWNVLVYPFNEEHEARAAFDALHICRVLYNPEGEEVDHRGPNLLAFHTIRKHTADRTHWCASFVRYTAGDQ